MTFQRKTFIVLVSCFLALLVQPVFALTPTEVAKLLAADGASLDSFGTSVSVSGDTAVIGALLDDDNGTDSGSAYIFSLSGDSDGDGVNDDIDMCQDTLPGEIVDPDGCSINQYCPCDSPMGSTDGWQNNPKYTSCVSDTADLFYELGLIAFGEIDVIVSEAKNSDCGFKDKIHGPGNAQGPKD